MCHIGKEVVRVFSEADTSRRNRQRRREDRFPQKQKRDQAPPGAWIECFAKIDIRATCAWHRRAKLGVDHAVTNREHRSQQPAKDRLRSSHSREDHSDGDERTNADHFQHVYCGRLN